MSVKALKCYVLTVGGFNIVIKILLKHLQCFFREFALENGDGTASTFDFSVTGDCNCAL